jgi:hypothetical protein
VETMDENEKKFLKALKDGNGYDFIANNYFTFTKEELKDIILELLFNTNVDDTIEELKQRWEH